MRRMAVAQAPDRNLALELVRVTEAAALGAGRWVGRGDKNAADQAAVDAMRYMLDTVPMDGVVVIGEGEKDEAPMLFNGESVGNGQPPRGRRRGRPARGHAPDVRRAAERDRRDRASPSAERCSSRALPSTWTRSPAERRSPRVIDIDAPRPAENVRRAAEAKGVEAERRSRSSSSTATATRS